jgi:hypothetical protein
MHQDYVDGHPVQPRPKLRLTSKIAQASMDLDEHLLDDVVQVRTRAEHPIDETSDILSVPLIEGTKRGRVAGCGTPNERVLIGHGRHYSAELPLAPGNDRDRRDVSPL